MGFGSDSIKTLISAFSISPISIFQNHTMKKLSSPISRCLLRHLSTTAPITIDKAKQKLQKPAKAFQIYSSVTNPFISPLSSYNAQQLTVQRLAKAHRFDDIETLIESLKNHPKITKESYFCNLIRCYGKAGMFDHAIQLYHQIEELGTPRSCCSFNALLAAGNDSGAFDRVRQMFDEMPQRFGIDPDKVKIRHAHDAEPEGLKELDANCLKPNMISYNYLLACYCRNGLLL